MGQKIDLPKPTSDQNNYLHDIQRLIGYDPDVVIGGPKQTPLRKCTCYPGEHPVPCPGKHALTECWRTAVMAETQEMIVELKGHDRQPHEQALLDYMMRVRTAIEGYGDGPLPRVQWHDLDKPTEWKPSPWAGLIDTLFFIFAAIALSIGGVFVLRWLGYLMSA